MEINTQIKEKFLNLCNKYPHIRFGFNIEVRKDVSGEFHVEYYVCQFNEGNKRFFNKDLDKAIAQLEKQIKTLKLV